LFLRGVSSSYPEEKNRLLVILVVGALLLNDGGSDTVEITLSVNGDSATTTGGVLLENADLLKGLEDLSR